MTARAVSQVQTLAEKNQHQAQIERDALRVVGLALTRASLLVPASVKPESPRCVSGPMACYCKGSGWMLPFNSLVRWAGVTNADDMRLLYLTFIQR